MRQMRDSGVEWLGEIPAPWTISKFRHIFRESKELNGAAPVGEMLSVSGYLGVVPKVYQEESLKRDADQLETYRVVRKGQLAVNTMWLNYGGLGVSELEGHMSPAYRAYWISADINPRFAHHLLRSQLYISGYTAFLTGVRPNSLQMSRENLMNFPVILPPLEEQKAIVKFLDNEAREIDTLISKKEQLIEKLLERRQALITQVVTKGLDLNVPMKHSGVEWLGQVPSRWKVAPMWSIASAQAGGTPESSTPEFWDDSFGTPWIAIGDMSGVREVTETSRAVSKLGLASKSLPIGRPGDVLLAMYASVGATAILGISATWNQAILGLRVKEDSADFRFLSFLLAGVTDVWNLLSNANTQANLNQHSVMHLRVPVPPLAEQKEIALYLDKETAQIDTLVEKTRKAIDLLKERRQALITQVVTGKIDVRGVAGGNS